MSLARATRKKESEVDGSVYLSYTNTAIFAAFPTYCALLQLFINSTKTVPVVGPACAAKHGLPTFNIAKALSSPSTPVILQLMVIRLPGLTGDIC